MSSIRRTRSLTFVADLLPIEPDTLRRKYHHHQQCCVANRDGACRSTVGECCRIPAAIVTSLTSSSADSMMASGKSSSVGDLLTASGGTLVCGDASSGVGAAGHGCGMEDFDSSWCSVDNLETDCVSPRVSTNSLFSQIDALTSGCADEQLQDFLATPDRGSAAGHPIAAAGSGLSPSHDAIAACRCDVIGGENGALYNHVINLPSSSSSSMQPPLYTKRSDRRRELLQASGTAGDESEVVGYQQQQHASPLLFRQLTTGVTTSGTTSGRLAGCSAAGLRRLVSSSRSVSCPSIIVQSSSPSRAVASDGNHVSTITRTGKIPAPSQTESKSGVVTSGTKSTQPIGRDQPVGTDTVDAATSVNAPTLLAPVNRSHHHQQHTTSGVSSSSARSSRSASPPKSSLSGSSRSSHRDAAAAAHSSGTGETTTWRSKRAVPTTSATGNRTSAADASGGGCYRGSRSLAQTKCLQWLNSFDEDD